MIITLQTLIFFRESLLNALDRVFRPYYSKFSLTYFGRNSEVSDDDDADDQVFAEFDEEKGVVFYPPVYLQRYAAVSDCLMDERWCGKLDKVVDLGYHDMSFIKYLKEVSGIRCILGVDLESIPLRCSSDLIGCDDYGPKRENPLQVTLFQGNAADPDYRLIGCDAVIAIEMIEHMLPHDLERLVHTVFGFIKPWVAIFTTPNGDFNILFKAMEKNGFRRLDHFFEWSREQFHDWCSNIVARYPEYTVTCKGIGPGPTGTLHLGCCSQMAIFVSKNYHKQQDLNLNSLALVSNAPDPYDVSEMIETWESPEPDENNMLCPVNNVESFTDIYSDRQSCMTILLTSAVERKSEYEIDNNETDALLRGAVLTLASLGCQDKTSQCNIENETAKNYLMFDYEQMCVDVVIPRRKMDNRVYMIEDVTSRLNCTTLQVTKFSKTTQNLIAKNKVDSLVHTREVVEEIRHLTKMLNFNEGSMNQPLGNGLRTWQNINWGDNAPYWNQYYKVVREYNPPYETKSEESRITELISDEINRLIDNQFDEDFSVDLNRLEIPIEHLMGVVSHITNDVEKVKELLEWDGYEIVNEVVIHSRLVIDNASTLGTQEEDWDNETYSEWDSTDVRSTSLSDGSTIQDHHGRCLRRALDQKVRKLRTMLTADNDITTELDRVVSKLMKLALRTSKGRRAPPPSRWMQCKLLDLLTLTEKAIERRKRFYIENFPLKTIKYEPSEKSQEMITLDKIKEDDTALKIVDKYRHLVTPENAVGKEASRFKSRLINTELKDDLSVTSSELLNDCEYIDRNSPSLYKPESTLTENTDLNSANETTKLGRTQAWLEDDLEVVPYQKPDNFDNDISSGDTEHSTSLTRYYKKSCKNYKVKKQSIELKCFICKKSHSKCVKRERKQEYVRDKNSKTKVTKKVSKNKSSNNELIKDCSNKCVSVAYRHYRVKPRKKKCKSLLPSASKPIPASLIELCHPELMIEDNIETNKEQIINFTQDDRCMKFNQSGSGIAATEQSLLIDIVMDNIQETIAMRRTIGTDASVELKDFENETLIQSVNNTDLNYDNFYNKHDENDQTIFLNDINEPSTSKGIRHVSMDVQCGPDASATYSILSATTSITRIPSIFNAGIKIGDSSTDTKMKSVDCNTETQPKQTSTDCCSSIPDDSDHSYKTISPRERANSIKIKESIPDFTDRTECSTMTQQTSDKMQEPKSSKSISKQNIIKQKTFTMSEQGSTVQEQEFTIMREQHSPSMRKQRSPKLSPRVQGSTMRKHELTMPQEQKPSITLKANKQQGSSVQEQKLAGTLELGSTMLEQEVTVTQEQESAITTEQSLHKANTSSSAHTDFSTDTTYLKSIPSGMIIGDSGSEFCDSLASIPKNLIGSQLIHKDVGVSRRLTRYVRPKLCCGGVQVHSYRDTQLSEDIMYQGEWQNHRPKVLTKRKICNTVVKRISDLTLTNKKKSKEILTERSCLKKNMTSGRSTAIQNVLPITKPILNKPIDRMSTLVSKCVSKVNKPIRATSKVPSKLTMGSVTSKNTKSAFVLKKPQITVVSTSKNEQKISETVNKKYLPYYLRKNVKRSANDKNSFNVSLDSAKTNICMKENTPKPPLVRSKTEEIKGGLLKFQCKVPVPKYVVLRNEKIEKKNSCNDGQPAQTPDSGRRRGAPIKRSTSPQSQNSSTCSSPSSMATVRAVSIRPKNVTNRRHSASSYKPSTAYSGSENTSPNKNKKFTKRCKSAKISDDKTSDKENIPQTSRQSTITSKVSEKLVKGPFLRQKKEVFIAQLKGSPPLQSTTTKKLKSNLNMGMKMKISTSTPISEKLSSKSNAASEKPMTASTEISNMVLVLEPKLTLHTDMAESPTNILKTPNIENNRLITDWIDSSKLHIAENQRSTLLADMKTLVEGALDFIDEPYESSYSDIDSETVILNRDDLSNTVPDLSSSPISIRTVITNENNSLQSDLEQALNRSFESALDNSYLSIDDTRMAMADLDLLSFKSINSASKFSEYLSAGSSQVKLPIAVHSISVKDIYERKESFVPINPGAIAIQAFSGFSINGEPISGDKPDPINLIDSETGSMAVDVPRQANSEELFISGRSSGSFESCLIDEEAVVPSWLFQIISQQQAAENEANPPQPLLVPLPMPEEPMYDANGNFVDALGLGAGAGDGRGMHSDRSQDSSGNGSSLSTSATSSGGQSEVILIDPAAFVAQFDGAALMIDSESSSLVMVGINDEDIGFLNAQGAAPMAPDSQSFSHGESTRRNIRARVTTASDIDADVSSLETDVPDSSDN